MCMFDMFFNVFERRFVLSRVLLGHIESEINNPPKLATPNNVTAADDRSQYI